ncbi:hypothetical protein DL98DRAFT_107098 [Cadophora sp. DSE1049]|nr:hypothetical protein DL98DRAFT_107098 [Cadophora sp. DSE1049]
MTVAMAALVVPVSSSLGQLRWIRADRSTKLSELDIIDRATRDPWGSLCMLCRRDGGVIGMIGAFVAALSLAAAPFAQQSILISTESSSEVTGDAILYFCQSDDEAEGYGYGQLIQFPKSDGTFGWNVAGDLNLQGDDNFDFPYTLRAAALNAIHVSYDNSSYAPDLLVCSTSTCDWEPFTTLGVVAQCRNTSIDYAIYKVRPFAGGGAWLDSDELIYPNQTPLKAKLPFIPGGAEIRGDNIFLNITGPKLRWASNRLDIAQFTVISTIPNIEPDGSRTVESELATQPGLGLNCTLSFCAQTIETSVINGTMIERVLGTYTDFEKTTTNDSNEIGGLRQLNTFSPPTESHSSFKSGIRIDPMNGLYFSQYFFQLFNGSYGRDQHTSDVMLGLYKNNGTDIPAILDDVASSLSHQLWELCRGRNEPGQRTGRQPLNGRSWTTVTLVRIRWQWLIFPVAIEVLGIVFFITILVVSRSSDAELWKTSMLAELLHGPEIERDDPRLRTVSGMGEVADGMSVRLGKGQDVVARLVDVRG